ncbi:MAG TPA: arabinofuranosidase catalytic domain-containing protein, partial [Polyangiaceae bacterium]|nr:arabinofuranosidase catalytic domain-containing protein [Polyangiaceae bacterium]
MRNHLVLFSSMAWVVSAGAAACSYDSKDPAAGTGGTAGSPGSGGSGVSAGGSTGGNKTGGTGGTMGGTGNGVGGASGSTSGGATGGAKGGTGATGGSTGGTVSQTGGSAGTGGATGGTGGGATGGQGATGSGGSGGSGGSTGGTAGAGAAGGAGPMGGAGGSGGASPGTGPCDIYAAASPATPCIAAYSTTRSLSSKYTGFLYQVRKGGNKTGTGGTTQDIGQIAGGFADSAAQDAFCGTDTCTFSILYDQSGKKNDLKVAPAGCYTGTAMEADYESNAKQKSVQLGGHKVYALYMAAHEGYRNNTPTSAPKGSESQGIYEVADGTHAGSNCCWDFGNASTNNCNQGTMNALFFG